MNAPDTRMERRAIVERMEKGMGAERLRWIVPIEAE